MIEGLKLRVTSAELSEHCLSRAGHHEKRAKDKQAELPALREAIERVKGTVPQVSASLAHMNKTGYRIDQDDPVGHLESDIRDHANKALVFRFFASHLFDEDYTLKEEDLMRLEILRR